MKLKGFVYFAIDIHQDIIYALLLRAYSYTDDSCIICLYAVRSRQPGEGRYCSSDMSYGFLKEASRCVIEAAGDICIKHISWSSLNREEYLLYRILA